MVRVHNHVYIPKTKDAKDPHPYRGPQRRTDAGVYEIHWYNTEKDRKAQSNPTKILKKNFKDDEEAKRVFRELAQGWSRLAISREIGNLFKNGVLIASTRG